MGGFSRRIRVVAAAFGLVAGTFAGGSAVAAPSPTAAASHAASSAAPFTLRARVPLGATDLESMSCWERTHCVAIGLGSVPAGADQDLLYTTTDSGHRWTTDSLPVGIGQITDVSCSEAAGCIASATWGAGVGGISVVLRSANGLTGCTGVTLPSSVSQLTKVACPSATVCLAGGESYLGPAQVDRSTDGGRTWNEVSIPDAGASDWPLGLSCSSTTRCLALIGGMGATHLIVTDDGGAAWQAGTDAPWVERAESLVCQQSICLAPIGTEGGVEVSRDGGQTWVRGANTDLEGPLVVACATAEACLAEADDNVARTTDAGRSWTGVSSPSSQPDILGIGCLTASACVLGGSPDTDLARATAWLTADGGNDWAGSPVGPAAEAIGGIACPTAERCAAAGALAGGGLVLAVDERSTSEATLPDDFPPLLADSCPTPADCYAVGGYFDGGPSVLRTTDAGSHWSKSAAEPDRMFTAVSCSAASSCEAVAGDVVAWTTTSGRTWGAAVLSAGQLADVSCVSASTCLAVGWSNSDAGVIFRTTDGGTSWTTPSLPDVDGRSISQQAGDIEGISCIGGGRCTAVGVVDPVEGDPPVSVALYSGDGGATWSLQSLPGGIEGFQAVSCSSAGACLAATIRGSGSLLIGKGSGSSTWRAVPVGGAVGAVAALTAAPDGRFWLIGVTPRADEVLQGRVPGLS